MQLHRCQKNRNKFAARIRHNGTEIYVKSSDNQLICAKAYDNYIVDNNIPGKKLNFPEDYPDYDANYIIKTKYKTTDDKKVIKLSIKSHPNEEVLFEKAEYDNIKCYSWCISNGYVNGRINGKTVYLHRFIMDVTNPNIFVDHIDGNILNNCKNNLRLSDSQKNSHNKSKSKNKSSTYMGVCFNNSRNTWLATIKYNYKQVTISSYHNEEYAARARDLYILIHYPDEHFKLNFKWKSSDINYWKMKLTTDKNNNKWIPVTSYNKMKMHNERMFDVLNNNNLLMLEKLLINLHKNTKSKIDYQTNILGIS